MLGPEQSGSFSNSRAVQAAGPDSFRRSPGNEDARSHPETGNGQSSGYNIPSFLPPRLEEIVMRTSGFVFTSPAADAQTRLSQLLPMSGVTVTQVTPGRIDGTLTVKDEANIVVLVVLLLAWILPGLIYWHVKSRPVTERFSLVFVPVATGTRISVQAGPKTMERLVPVMGQLPW
jgi:hypothetical protein